MRERIRQLALVMFAGLCGVVALEARQSKADNTAANKQDRNGASVTAEQQKNNRSDLDITRDIRRAIVADKTLSTYAKNIKVVTQKGHVTLRGPVRTEAEKHTLETKAADIAGTANVTNSLSVVPVTPRKTK